MVSMFFMLSMRELTIKVGSLLWSVSVLVEVYLCFLLRELCLVGDVVLVVGVVVVVVAVGVAVAGVDGVEVGVEVVVVVVVVVAVGVVTVAVGSGSGGVVSVVAVEGIVVVES